MKNLPIFLNPIRRHVKKPLALKLVTLFRNDACRLFDIACCKCKSFEECRRDLLGKVPQLERSFLTDQRTKRAIGPVDRIIAEKLKKKSARKSQEYNRLKIFEVEKKHRLAVHFHKIYLSRPMKNRLVW